HVEPPTLPVVPDGDAGPPGPREARPDDKLRPAEADPGPISQVAFAGEMGPGSRSARAVARGSLSRDDSHRLLIRPPLSVFRRQKFSPPARAASASALTRP